MIKEDRLKMLKDMMVFCDGIRCDDCPVSKNFPKHECGCGKWYHDDEWSVSDNELERNHAVCFEEETAIYSDSFNCDICGRDTFDNFILCEIPGFEKTSESYKIKTEDHFICEKCATKIATFISLMKMGEITMEEPKEVFKRVIESINTTH